MFTQMKQLKAYEDLTADKEIIFLDGRLARK